jgi:hypothetical protein
MSARIRFVGASFPSSVLARIRELGPWDDTAWPKPAHELNWTNWRPITFDAQAIPRRATQMLDEHLYARLERLRLG